MGRNYENGQRGTDCIKKNIQKSSKFLTRGKNKKYMWGQEEIKMAIQAADPLTEAVGNTRSLADYRSNQPAQVRSLVDYRINPRAQVRTELRGLQLQPKYWSNRRIRGTKKVALINALKMLTLHNTYLFPADCYA
jgi:hypothetical protein